MTELLREVYPEHEWNIFQKSTKHANNFWNDVKIQREFLHYVESELNISSVEEWLQVKRQDFIRLGGQQLLRYYPSIENMLRSLLPEKNWPTHKENSLDD